MTSPVIKMLYFLAMAVVIVSVDVLFFRHHFWPRLGMNVGIVLVFLSTYCRVFGSG
jgi:hypothetical protein